MAHGTLKLLGGVFGMARKKDKQVLYYPLVMRHPDIEEPAILLSEAITCDHTVDGVYNFMTAVLRNVAKVSPSGKP